MKILFFSSYMATPHYETELELMEDHLQKGDEVIQIVCNRSLKTCLANKDNDLNTCARCISKRNKGVSLLSKPIKTIDIANYFKEIVIPALPKFKHIGELKKYYVENFDAGYATASTIIGWYSKANPILKDTEPALTNLLNESIKVFYALKQILKAERPELVYIFNGRFGIERAAIRACEAEKINFYTHERGAIKDSYSLFKNKLPHSLMRDGSFITDYWNNGSTDKEEIARSFYEDRLNRTDKGWFSFVTDQQMGKLPESWDAEKHNIVIYNSSEFEFAAIGDEWENTIYSTQANAVLKLNEYLNAHPLGNKYKVYLRVHPHVKKHFHEEEEIVKSVINNNIEIISSLSDVCTYTLMFKSAKVVTFGSTMGPEATFWGKPAILLGVSFYKELDCVYDANSIKELVELITNENLPPKDKTGVLKFGYFHQSHGTLFEHYKAETLFEGNFNGVNLDSDPPAYIAPPKKNIFIRIYNKALRTLRD